MSFITALAICLGVIGGILAYLALGPAAGLLHIWLIFLATAMGVALGGTVEAYKNMVICAIFGIITAWAASLIVLNIPLAATLTLPVWAGIVVGFTTFFFVVMAHVPLLSAIPGTVVGYASTFAYLLQGADKSRLSTENLLSVSITNPLICMTVSVIVAAAFGLVSLKLATMMSSAATAPAALPSDAT